MIIAIAAFIGFAAGVLSALAALAIADRRDSLSISMLEAREDAHYAAARNVGIPGYRMTEETLVVLREMEKRA